MADIFIGTATTVGGLAAFASLPAGNYRLVQNSAPTGYTPAAAAVVPIVDQDVNEALTNVPANSGTLIVNKIDAVTHGPLAGATFKLTQGATTIVSESTPTQAGGTVTFPNLMTIPGSELTYTVAEVAVPANHYKNDIPADAKIYANDTRTATIPDVPHGAYDMNLKLTDATYTEVALNGATYTLYYIDA